MQVNGLSKAVLGLAALLLAIPLAIAGQGILSGVGGNLLQLGAATTAAVACFWAARRALPALKGSRLPWLLLGASCAAWALGQAVWTVQEQGGQEVPFPGPADIGFLSASVLAIPAVLLFMKPPASRRELWLLLLDGLGTSLLLMITAWVLLLRGPTLAEPDHLMAAIAAAYPLLDLVILGALLSAFPRMSHTGKRRLWPLVAGLSCITFADLAFNYASLTGSYATGQWPDLGWIGGFALIAVLARDPGASTNPLRMGSPTGLETALPFAAVPLAGAAVIGAQLRGVAPDPTLVWAAVLWLLTASSRQFLLLRSQQSLLEKVQQNFALERDAAGMRERVTELERLQAQERFRTEFINKTAHEFSTPLTPIRLQLRTMMGGNQTPEAAQRSLEMLERNFNRLANLADDLVDAARIDSSRLVLNRRNVDLAAVIDVALQGLRTTLDARSQWVEVTIKGPQWVLGDPLRLEQAVASLVLRAADASPPGKAVHIVANGVDGQSAVTIQHEGKLDEKAFDPFGAPGLPAASGSAVRLHVVKGLLKLHGSDLVHTQTGAGGVFSFTLPQA